MKPRAVKVEGSVVYVPLDKRYENYCVVDKADYDRLMELGLPPNWRLVGGQVTAGQNISVGRVIAGAYETELVRFADRDRLNLRRSNLHLFDTLRKLRNDRRDLIESRQKIRKEAREFDNQGLS